MRYGLGAEAAPAGQESGGWKNFWQNLAQNAVTNVASQVALLKPPTTPTAAAPTAPSAATSVTSTAKSIWPILAVAGGGLAALVGIMIIKKKG